MIRSVWTNGYVYFYNENVGRKLSINPKKALISYTADHKVEYLEEIEIA